MKKKFITVYGFTKQVIEEYLADNVIKYSASLAYYTILSLAPMLVIIISISGILFGKEAMKGEVYSQINGLVGNEAALQVQDIMQHIHLQGGSHFAGIVSSIILLIGATGIFGEMQDSLNKIWGLRSTSKKAWWKLILNRLLSFSMIICMGFILMVSLVMSAAVATISDKLNGVLHGVDISIIPVANTLLSVFVTMMLFAAIFKVLPDARIKWKDVLIGAFITAVLFSLGKSGIGYYLSKSNLTTVFGAAGSMIIIMIWVYYSSAIVYLGAVCTKVYAGNFGDKIHPTEYSTWIKVEEVPVKEVVLHQQTH